jgi:hypothetical protein
VRRAPPTIWTITKSATATTEALAGAGVRRPSRLHFVHLHGVLFGREQTLLEGDVREGGGPSLVLGELAAADIKTTKLRGSISAVSGSGGNMGVVVGDDGKLLVGAGITATRPRIEEALAEPGPQPIKHLIDSHGHLDHTDGNEWLNSERAMIMAHPNTLKHRTVATRCLALGNPGRIAVTARLLPRRFCFDASDEQLVVNKAVEEVVPFLG